MVCEFWYNQSVEKTRYVHIDGFLRSNIVFKAKFTWKRRSVTKHSYFWLYSSLSLHLINHLAHAAKSLQSCLILCDPRDWIPVPGILQVRTLEWVAISFSNAWKWKGKGKKWNAWKWKVKGKVVSDSSRPHGLQPTRLLRPRDLPGKSTGVGCHRLQYK